MLKGSAVNCLVSFAFGVAAGVVCHIYYVHRATTKKAERRARAERDEVHSQLDTIFRAVLAIQGQLQDSRPAHNLDLGTVAQNAPDLVDAVAPGECPSRGSDDIFYDTSDSVNGLPDGDSCNSVKALFSQVDHNLEDGSCDRQTLYEQLKRHLAAQSLEPNFWWRLAKAAHFLSKSGLYVHEENKAAKKRLLYEAFEHAQRALQLDDQNADCHKWYAITIGCLNEYCSAKEKIANGAQFKEHLDIAMKLKQDDSTLYYLAGRFCVELLSLSWIERKVANTFFGTLPPVSHQDALEYFYKAHTLKPQWKENILYIVQMLLAIKDQAQAKRYLEQGLAIAVATNEDLAVQEKLQEMSKSVQ